MGPHNAAVAPDDVDQTAALAADAADDGFGDRLDGHPTDIPEVPMVVYRRTLLPPERVRELSRRRPWRVVADTALCWAIIVAAWLAAAAIGTWWAILLAVLVVGNRYYSLFIIGHDGMHRRLFADMGRNDLFTDVFVLAPILSITHLNNRNHMRHHQMLGSEADPDRHKHACFNKADLLGLIGWHQEAEVVAGGAVANHTNAERVEYAEDLFTHAAGTRQLVADDSNQRQIFFHFHAAQLREFDQQRLRQQGVAG